MTEREIHFATQLICNMRRLSIKNVLFRGTDLLLIQLLTPVTTYSYNTLVYFSDSPASLRKRKGYIQGVSGGI